MTRSEGEAPPILPDRAGRFRVQEQIGRGADGAVHRGEDDRTAQEVALKFLHVNDDIAARRARFERAAALWGRLDHPNIARIIEVGEADGTPFIAMELVRGRHLGRLIRAEGPLAPSRAVALTRQILAALREAHRQGVIHRDIKPQNILIADPFTDAQGGVHPEQVKVVDFGLARAADTGEAGPRPPQLTVTGQILGTPRYMAPEQVDHHTVCEASDLYSVGLIFYEMLAGRPAIEHRTTWKILLQQLQHEPVVHPEDRLVPPPLRPVLNRAVVKRVQDRFPDADAFIAALDAAIAGQPLPEPGPPLGVSSFDFANTLEDLTYDLRARAAGSAPSASGSRPSLPRIPALALANTDEAIPRPPLTGTNPTRPAIPKAVLAAAVAASEPPPTPAPPAALHLGEAPTEDAPLPQPPALSVPPPDPVAAAPPLRAPELADTTRARITAPKLPAAPAAAPAAPVATPAAPAEPRTLLKAPPPRAPLEEIAPASALPNRPMIPPRAEPKEAARRPRRLWIAAIAGGVLLLVALGALWGRQRWNVRTVYGASPLSQPALARLQEQRWDRVALTDDGLVGWFGAPRAAPRAALLLLPGRHASPEEDALDLDALRDQGVAVFVLAHRGFGASLGAPDAEAWLGEARLALAALRERAGLPDARIFALGRNLDAATAATLAADQPLGGLILEALETDSALLQRELLLPLGRSSTAASTVGALDAWSGPVLFLHGDQDAITPLDAVRERSAQPASGRRTLEIVPGGAHTDLVDTLGSKRYVWKLTIFMFGN